MPIGTVPPLGCLVLSTVGNFETRLSALDANATGTAGAAAAAAAAAVAVALETAKLAAAARSACGLTDRSRVGAFFWEAARGVRAELHWRPRIARVAVSHKRPHCTSGRIAQVAILHRWPHCTCGRIAQAAALHRNPGRLVEAVSKFV